VLTKELAMLASAVPFSGRPLLRTSSVEEAQAGGGRLLARHRLRARDDGFQARINGVSFGGLSLYYMRYGTPLTVTSAPLESLVAAIVPLRGSMRVEHAGSSFVAEAGRSAAVISPETPMRLDWSEDLEFFCFRIEVAALLAYLRSLEPDADAGEAIRFEPRMTGRAGLSSMLGCAWLIELASQQLKAARRDDWPPALPARLCEQVMTTLLLAQPRSRRSVLAPDRASSVSRRAASRAREFVEESQTLAITPSELAAEVGVCLRTLQLGFRDELGTTPQAYITEARLRRAHSELVCASPQQGATVAAIAARWGFSNVGRFADKYHAAYGRKPAETLRRG
jgi:AraC-like DNA-binding protein